MRILLVEPYHTGSHAAFVEALTGGIEAEWSVATLPGRHWKWRMRGSAAYLTLHPDGALEGPFDLLVASAYVPLAELVGLVPRLASIPRLLYFHENQLAYPVRPEHAHPGDVHFGLTQMVSALAASVCLFNSRHNRDSFLAGAEALLARMPDRVPPGWVEAIRAKSQVLPVPLALPELAPACFDDRPDPDERERGPLIVWNHRWEYDKRPDRFFAALAELSARQVPFRLAVCGQRFRQAPPVFESARAQLGGRVVHWGFVERRADYLDLLARAHLAVSTADHEFFGLAMLEATWMGARPLVPDRLAYPEHFPHPYRYRDEVLVDRLEALCRGWVAGDTALRADRRQLVRPLTAKRLLPRYRELFDGLVSGRE